MVKVRLRGHLTDPRPKAPGSLQNMVCRRETQSPSLFASADAGKRGCSCPTNCSFTKCRVLYALKCRTHRREYGAFQAQTTIAAAPVRAPFTHDFALPTIIAPPRIANSIMAARRRNRRHHKNHPQRITCVITPQGFGHGFRYPE